MKFVCGRKQVMYNHRKIDLKLTVFSNMKVMIINQIFSQLNKLMKDVRLDVVYGSSFRNTFYCKRSSILQYLFCLPKDPILKEQLTKYHIHYVENKGFLASKNVFVLQISGYSRYKIYKECNRYTRNNLYDLSEALSVDNREIKFSL
jgi:hypothetical protein